MDDEKHASPKDLVKWEVEKRGFSVWKWKVFGRGRFDVLFVKGRWTAGEIYL